MKIATTNINSNGIILSKNALNKLIFKYNGVLGRALFKLYDLGYQSSPASFDLADFRGALLNDFPKEIFLLRDNMTGKIALEDEIMVKYAMFKTTDKDFKSVLSIYLDTLVAEKALDSFNILISRIKIPKKSDSIKIKPRLGVSGRVSNFNTLPLDNSAIRESFLVEDDEELITYNTSNIMVKAILIRLGYSSEDYLKHKSSGESFFITGVSQEDELSLLPNIINGKISADGKFGADLVADVNKYYEDFYKTHDTHIHCLNYEEVIFNLALDERIDLINKKRESFGDNPFREFYVTTNEVIFAVKTQSNEIKKSYFKDNKLQLGIATLSHENRSEFSKINTLCGLCGEFIHESVVIEKGWVAEGLPISIKFGILTGKRFKLNELNYYPIYNVHYCEDSASITPFLGNEIHIIVSELEDVFKKLGVSSKAELFNKFLDATDVNLPSPEIDRRKYEELVADLSTALVYSECGILDYDMYRVGYNWVTDDIFYRACTEAEQLFRSFGF